MTSPCCVKRDGGAQGNGDDGDDGENSHHNKTMQVLPEVSHLPVFSADDLKDFISPGYCDNSDLLFSWSTARFMDSEELPSVTHSKHCNPTELTGPSNFPSFGDHLKSYLNREHQEHGVICSDDGKFASHVVCDDTTDGMKTITYSGEIGVHGFSKERTIVGPDYLAGSSCSSPPVTPPYLHTSVSVQSFISTISDSDVSGSPAGDNILKIPSPPKLSDWEAIGDTTQVQVVSQPGQPLCGRAFYGACRNSACGSLFHVGDVMLLRRPTQEWFDRMPLVMEVVDICHDFPIEMTCLSVGILSIRLRRYYGASQVSCLLPDIALEMTSREAVIFASGLTETLTPECSLIGRGLILSVGQYYRFCAELMRRRHGRTSHRRPAVLFHREQWHDWVDRPESVFVLCGNYEPATRELESF